jgi:hypothetical protein
MPATSLTLRLQKGSPLTYTELDNNFLFVTSSISSSINTAISGSVNRVAVFSSANKITGSSILTDNGTSLTVSGYTTITADSTIDPVLSITSTSGYPGIYSETDSSVGVQGYSTGTGTGVLATTDTGIALKAIGPVQITGSIVASGSTYTFKGTTTVTGSLIVTGSTHTLTSTTTNINSTALNLNSNHITASGQTTGDVDFTIAPGGVGSATINLKANTGGTSILNATGNNNTLSIKTNSIERINIDGNGTTAITGSLVVTGSNTLIGTKIITGSVFISGSKTIIGTNTITGSLLVTGSTHTIKGTTTISGSVRVSGSLTVNTTTFNSKRYIALIDQSGTNTPTVSTLGVPTSPFKNDFTANVGFNRTAPGQFNVTCADFSTATKVIGRISFSETPTPSEAVVLYDNTLASSVPQAFYSYANPGTFADGIISFCLLEIEAFY